MKEKKILEVAKYIIENKATIETTANHFNMSISSIKKYINNEENLKSIDIDIYNDVKKVQQYLIELGNHIGGKNGIGTHKSQYTEFEDMEIAEVMISDSLTLEEASIKFNMPTSTLYERIRSINDEKIQSNLDILFEANKRGSFKS